MTTTTHDEPSAYGELEPIPVVIRDAAEFTPVWGAWQTLLFQGIATETQPLQILPTDKQRRRAYIQVRPQLGSPAQNENSVTSPGAGATILTITAASIAPGWYTVNWAVELDGTPGAGDVDNFILKGPSLGAGLTSANDGAVGRYPQSPVTIYVASGNALALTVKTVAAGTAGAIYTAQVTLTPLVVPGGYVLVGTLGQVSNGQGGRIYAGDPRWELKAHGLLYIAGDGVTALTVTVLVERDQVE